MTGRDHINHIFFVGIGGIGMSALARYFKAAGAEVAGYDRAPSGLTDELTAEGIPVKFDEGTDDIMKNAEVVVFTPAIPEKNGVLRFYRDGGYDVVKRSDVLQWITDRTWNICVAGTHGKTTTSTMIAHILRDSGKDCNAFLGGISANYQTNFWGGKAPVTVVEADEYDRSFLKLSPDVAVITSMDPDHLDIYGTEEAMEQAFVDFSARIRPGGVLVSKLGLRRDAELRGSVRLRYHLSDSRADVYAKNIRPINGSYHYQVEGPGWKINDVELHVGGMHNIENSIAAAAAAKAAGISEEGIRKGLASFRGVRRRFEYYLKDRDCVLIDDYAHHPEELRALISGVRSLYGDAKLTVVFQPHLFSRTKDHAAGFASALDLADEVFLLPIYPARELPVEGVNSQLIAGKMTAHVKCIDKDELLDELRMCPRKLVAMAGAGDIDRMLDPVKEILKSCKPAAR